MRFPCPCPTHIHTNVYRHANAHGYTHIARCVRREIRHGIADIRSRTCPPHVGALVYTDVYTHASTRVDAFYLHRRTHVYIRTCVYTSIHMSINMPVLISVHMSVSMSIHMLLHMPIHMPRHLSMGFRTRTSVRMYTSMLEWATVPIRPNGNAFAACVHVCGRAGVRACVRVRACGRARTCVHALTCHRACARARACPA